MTKQLNKKGTSLVELIAVIVIMGIIAGIAVPVTISVINRQKKNAAVKSAEAVVATIKQYVNEIVGEATTTTISVELGYGNAEVNKPTSVKINNVAATNYEDFLVENLKATGTITATYTIASASYSYTVSSFKVSGYFITYDATNAKFVASTTAPTT